MIRLLYAWPLLIGLWVPWASAQMLHSGVRAALPEPSPEIVARAEAILLARAPAPGESMLWAGRILARTPPAEFARPGQAVIERGTWPARRQVAMALATRPHPRRMAWLATLAGDPSWSVRSEALRTVGLIGDAAGHSLLIQGTRDPVWSVRWQAVRSLAAFPPGPLPTEPAAPASPDGATAPRSTASAWRQAWREALFVALRDPDAQVRSEAERVLLTHPQPEALAVYLAILDRKADRKAGQADRSLQAARTLLALGSGSAADALRQRLRHPSLATRILAARALQLRGQDLTPWLETLVGDALTAWGTASGPVQASAEGLLRSLGPRAARIALARIGQGHGRSMLDDVSRWIVTSLGADAGGPGNAPSPGIADLVQALAGSTFDDPARQALVDAMSLLGTRAPRTFLERAFVVENAAATRGQAEGKDDSRGGYRTSIFRALARTAPYPGWERVLETGLTDPALHVRRTAALHWIRTSGQTRPHDRLARELTARRSDYFGSDFLRQAATLGDTATFDFLMALAQGTYSQKARLRVDALNALTSVRWRPFQQKKLIEWLRRRLAAEPDGSARTRILLLLANQDPNGSVELIARAALDRSEKPDVRVLAINRLGASRQPRAARPLRTLLERPDPPPDRPDASESERIKAAALRALFALGQRDDLSYMIRVLETGPERARRLALSALERLRDPACRNAVEAMTRNGLVQDENRARGFRVLAAIEGPDVADMLLKRLREEEQSELRIGALDALGLMKPEAYGERLVHYLRALENGRHHDTTSRDRFAEFLGELGRVPVPVVTGFLIDFLLEEQSGAQARPRAGRRADPLHVSARAALLGHDPNTVRKLLAARLDALATTTSGAGLPESFYHDLIRLFSHPTHRAVWGDLAVDLSRRLLATPPWGSPLDHDCLRLIAERSFEVGRFGDAADAYRHRHGLAVLEGYLDRQARQSALVENPLGRQRAVADLAALLAGRPDPDSGPGPRTAPAADPEAERNRRILAAVQHAPTDRITLTTAIQTSAHLGGGYAAALSCLERLGSRRRHPEAALARYELGLACLRSGRTDEALILLRHALADHPPLLDLARREQTLVLHLKPEVRNALLNPEGDTP